MGAGCLAGSPAGRTLGLTGACLGLGGATVRGATDDVAPLGRAPPVPGLGVLLRRELKKLARTPSFSPAPAAPPPLKLSQIFTKCRLLL